MSGGMNLEEANEYAKTMSYRKAVNNIRYAKGIAYKKATRIKLRELAEIADRLVTCGECKWLRYCETEDLDLYLDCDKPDGGGIPRSEDWFCADGEREGE